MSSSNIWISPFIEHCLSSYRAEGRRPDPDLQWDDDGSRIRFSSSLQNHALINTWNDGDDLSIANVTDSDTQIDAILSRESLKVYNETYPAQPLSKDRCRGYFIRLTNFELVYEYSTGKPKVHFYVKRFIIIWERGKTKAPPQGKSAGKKPALLTLMKKVFSRIKSRAQQAESPANARSNNNEGISDIPSTQTINSYTVHPTPSHLMTQLPSHLPPIDVPNNSPKRDAAPSGRLLDRLAPLEDPGVRQSSRERSMDTQSINQLPVPEAAPARHNTNNIPPSNDERHKSAEAHRPKPTAKAVALVVDGNINSRPSSSQRNTDHLFQHNLAETRPTRTDTALNSPERAVGRLNSPYSPEKQLVSQLEEASKNATLQPDNPVKDTSPITLDPWEGMTEISSIDVMVPKDQQELLGYERKPWYPPPPGERPVTGHVPPNLLDKWNRIVRQNSWKAGENESKSLEDEQLPSRSTPAPDPNPDSEEESEEELLASQWSPSPEPGPRHQLLPADSSPVRGGSVELRGEIPSMRGGNTTTTSLETHDKDHGNQTSSEIIQDRDASTPTREPGVANNEPPIEAIAPGTTHGEDDGHESDGSSPDSVMDIAVAQPLSDSTQPEQSSHLEGEISSSGPPLSESTRQDIQVVETPPAVLNKSRSMMLNGGGLQPGTHVVGQMSSQAGKSSSQSRVFNTYASIEGDNKGETSQDTLNSLASVTDSPNRVHVIGTPMSGEVQPIQGPTPSLQSSSLWNSSDSKSTGANVPTTSAYQSQSSNPFSSYRELPPSSMISMKEDERSPSIPSSAQETPLGAARVLPLKRYASEIEINSQDASPSKRSKVDHGPIVPKLENGLDERIIYRRQSYIINSAQSVEASRVYEKFRNDYPSYAGDYAHFTKLCARLQAFRESGSLQRSFLWDDFIIKHLEDYPLYLGECSSGEAKALNYEEFFASTASRPTYKKRSLIVDGIKLCAAQIISLDDTTTATSSGPLTDLKTSFTDSLRDQFSNFHAHSFAVTQDTQSRDVQSEAAHMDTDTIPSEYSIPDSEPARAARETDEFMEDVKDTAYEPPAATTAQSQDEYIEGVDESAHETASLELGEVEDVEELVPSTVPVSVPNENTIEETPPDRVAEHPAPAAAADAAMESDIPDEDESMNENWFLSLRHIFPTEPVWSDDPNTPFKKWARADQNVLRERYHRGGVYVPVDEKGIIQRMNYQKR